MAEPGQSLQGAAGARSSGSAPSALLAKRCSQDRAPILTKKASIYEDGKAEGPQLSPQTSLCPSAEVERAARGVSSPAPGRDPAAYCSEVSVWPPLNKTARATFGKNEVTGGMREHE